MTFAIIFSETEYSQPTPATDVIGPFDTKEAATKFAEELWEHATFIDHRCEYTVVPIPIPMTSPEAAVWWDEDYDEDEQTNAD